MANNYKPFWLVLKSVKSGYVVHSIHSDKARAESWRQCLEHDGHDTALAEVPGEVAEGMAQLLNPGA